MKTIRQMLRYEIIEINSYDICQNESSPGIYSVGWDEEGNEYRIILKIDLNSLPTNIQIKKVSLSMHMKIENNLVLQGYAVLVNDMVTNLNWLRQPAFGPQDLLFCERMIGSRDYTFDITGVVKLWQNTNEMSGGIALIGNNPNECNFISLFINSMQNMGINVDVSYSEPEDDTSGVKRFKDIIYINGIGTYKTIGRELSDYNIKSFFVANHCNGDVNIEIEGSPDLKHFVVDLQNDLVPAGTSHIFAANYYCVYYRLSITASSSQTMGPVEIWWDCLK